VGGRAPSTAAEAIAFQVSQIKIKGTAATESGYTSQLHPPGSVVCFFSKARFSPGVMAFEKAVVVRV